MKSIAKISSLLCIWIFTMSVNSGTKSNLDKPIPQIITASYNSSQINEHGVKTEKVVRKNAKAKNKSRTPSSGKPKSWVAAFLFAFFFGLLGVHRFYLGYTTIGIIQLLTLGGFGVWALVDFIRILAKELKPMNGEYKEEIEKSEKAKNATPSNG